MGGQDAFPSTQEQADIQQPATEPPEGGVVAMSVPTGDVAASDAAMACLEVLTSSPAAASHDSEADSTAAIALEPATVPVEFTDWAEQPLLPSLVPEPPVHESPCPAVPVSTDSPQPVAALSFESIREDVAGLNQPPALPDVAATVAAEPLLPPATGAEESVAEVTVPRQPSPPLFESGVFSGYTDESGSSSKPAAGDAAWAESAKSGPEIPGPRRSRIQRRLLRIAAGVVIVWVIKVCIWGF